MTNAYMKNVLRTILGNKRRSLLLMLITALGAAFFVGLRSASPDMNVTFEQYFDGQAMYDIQLLTTLGLTDAHIRALRAVDGVSRAEPAYSTDQFAKLGDASYLIRLHSAAPPGTDEGMLAAPVVVAGHMPEYSGECAVSYRFSQISGCGIGDTLSLSTGDDTLLGDYVARDTYVVTGLIESPLYLLAELGTSSKGSGTLQAYAYIPFDDFTGDVYTEAHISISNPAGLSRFDDAFGDLSAAVEERLQALGDEFTARRRRTLMARASKELSAGAARLAEAQNALTQSGLELDAAEAALFEQERALSLRRAAFEEEAARGRAQIAEGHDAADAAHRELEQAARQLADGRAALAQTRALLEAGALPPSETAGALLSLRLSEAELDAQARVLALSGAELDARRQTLLDGGLELEDTLSAGRAALAAAGAELAAARSLLQETRLAYEVQRAGAELEFAASQRALNEARAELRNMPAAKCHVLGLDKNFGFASFEQDSARIDAISRVFPLIFFLVAALVAFTGMVRIVEDDRPTVAAMQSLGYGMGAVLWKYIMYALGVGVLGTVLGIAAGYRLFPAVIFDFGYKIMYLIPALETPLHLPLCLKAFAISLTSVVAPTVAVAAANMRQTPASLMRPKAPPPGRRILLERAKRLWMSMRFSSKVTARNILRYKKRFFMTVSGIVGCTAVVLTGFGVRDSIDAIAANQFDRVYQFDFQITVSDEIGRADRTALERYLAAQDDVTGWLYQYRENMDAAAANGDTYGTVLVVPEDAGRLGDFIRLSDPRTGQPFELGEDGVIITQKLGSLLGVGAGDTLVLRDEDDEQITAEISAVTENYVGHYVYMSKAYYRALTDSEPAYSTLVCAGVGPDPARRDALSERILENAGVSALSFNEVTRDFYADMIDSLNVVVVILIVSGALLAFVVLFSLTGINIDERKREIATLKVLGFYDGEASSYIFRENVVNTAVGAAAGLGFGVLLHQFVIRTSEVDMVMFGKTIAPLSYVVAAALTFLFMLIVNAAMTGSIRSIDMIESLKSVE